RCRMSIRKRGADSPQFGLRQLTRYTLNEQGWEVAADLYLDCEATDLNALELSLDASLKVIGVTHETAPLPWNVSVDNDGRSRVRVNFPTGIRGLNRLVRVTAVAPPPQSGEFDLPRLHVPLAMWQQEALQLRIASPFELQDLRLNQAIQVPQMARELSSTTAAIAVQCQSAQYTARLVIGPATAGYEVKSACRIEPTTSELRAALNVDVRSRTNNNFQIQAWIAPDWILDLESIESETPELIDEWQVSDLPSAPGHQVLNIRFAQALPTESWTMLTIRARRSLEAAHGPLAIQDLQPLEFPDATESPRHFLVVQSTPTTEVSYPADGQMTWFSLDDLDGNRETQLLGTAAPDRLVLLDPPTLRQPIEFRERTDEAAELSAAIEVLQRCGMKANSEQIRLDVQRMSGRLNKLYVRLSQAREEEVRWYLESPLQRELTAKRVTGSDEDVGELWEIDWPELTADSLTLVGERSWSSSGTVRASLARVLNVTKSEGKLLLEGPPNLRLLHQAQPFLTPLPVGQSRANQNGNLRFAFRYTPLADNIFASEHEVELTFAENNRNATPVTVWRLSDETHLELNGGVRHDVTLWLENPGADQLLVSLAADCQLRQVTVNGVELTTTSDNDADQLQVPLVQTDRYPCVQIRYDEPGSRLRSWQNLAWHPLEIDGHVISRQWQVWVPTDLALASATPLGLMDRLRRLEGPFRRLPNERPFNLFSYADWNELWSGDRRDQNISALCRAVVSRLGRHDARTLSQALVSEGDSAVWIDPRPIAERGIGPQTPLPDSHSLSDYERGLDRLERLGLACIEVNHGVLLTSSDSLSAQWHSEPTRESPWLQRLPEHKVVTSRVVDTQGNPIGPPLLPLDAWQRTHFPWQVAFSDRSPDIAAGWQAHSFDLARTKTITVYRRTLFWLLSYAAFLAAMATNYWLKQRHARRCLLLPGLSIAAMLLVEAPWLAVTQACIWGALIGLLVPRMSRRAAPPVSRISTVTRAAWVATGVIAAVLCWPDWISSP
ncbi:MAG: hypothetical protein KDB23_24445, partial [Planctomycetales bacterium]|nr:hypothetical protein [Planctomycetales bacterium]